MTQLDMPGSPGELTPVRTAVGAAAEWDAPGWPQWSEGALHHFATREVVSAPTSAELPAGEEPATVMHRAAARLVTSAVGVPGCAAVELRYVVEPAAGGPSRVRVYVTAKTRDRDPVVAVTAVEAACAALPSGFVTGAPDGDPVRDPSTRPGDVVVELRRVEQVTTPQWDYVPADFYYAVHGEPGDGTGWRAFWSVLSAAREPVTVSVLFAQTQVHPGERDVLGALLSDLGLLAEPHTDSDFFGNSTYFPACANARAVRDAWQERMDRLGARALLARVAVRSSPAAAVQVATALAAAVSESATVPDAYPFGLEAPTSPMDQAYADLGMDWMEVLPWGGHPVWDGDQAPHTLRRFPYLYGASAAAGLAVLPIPEPTGAPGLPRSRRVSTRRAEVRASTSTSESVLLGDELDLGTPAGPVPLPLAAVNRHVLVVGSSGSGKSSTVFGLLSGLWTQHRIPFLAIETVKTEYRALTAAPGMADTAVITLGREDLSPLRLNPLEPPPGVRCAQHQQAVLTVLKAALPLDAPLPMLISEALTLCFARAGWDDDTTVADGPAPPTLRALLRAFDEVFDEAGYRGEAMNIAAAGRVRLGSLVRGSLGKVLDTARSSDLTDLLSRPTVVELDELPDNDDKAVMAALLLDRVRASARQRRAAGLAHVTVVEEAHRLFAGGKAAPGETSGRDRAVEAFTEAIAELRSLGEGFVLSTQRPEELARSAVANTGTRIVHRLESAADRAAVLDDADVDDDLRAAAARLRTGEAVVRMADMDEALIVRVVAPPVGTADRMPDERVAELMAARRREVMTQRPFRLCGPIRCAAGCSASVRSAGRRVAVSLEREARTRWTAAGWNAGLDVAVAVAAEADGDARLAACAAAQLDAAEAAFTGRRGTEAEIDRLLRAAGTGRA